MIEDEWINTAGISVPNRSHLATNKQVSKLVERWGKIGPEIGRGREKSAKTVGGDLVLVKYHGEHRGERPLASAATAEYWAAMCSMHKILHILMPENFPYIEAAVEGGILVERIPDSPDLIEARRINAEYTLHDFGQTREDRQWYEAQITQMKNNPEFQIAIQLFDLVGITDAQDHSSDELALPVNSTMRNGHPVFLEMMQPIAESGLAGMPYKPRMDFDKLTSAIKAALEHEIITVQQAEEALEEAKIYLVAAREAAFSVVNEQLSQAI
ncbi:MAG: hypothetical protein A3A82_01670 [Candidatus Pacebacteria bacterium RIFCSPLOWO2_01_FULL_47_12]|nr:MAG: hypothetical protein A3J60_02590 [Candidatus Pacebacteria bacterium RIFCSPHIGHO2_02_FULL_46_9]OGJ39399.1 MAG: hypothetical protein A3A82_01670 [Candidatus Pacebacteria bacterium RIFCSPLOWO2_01_FULL_47_12]